jgi:type IV pilus assembly protein PilY1
MKSMQIPRKLSCGIIAFSGLMLTILSQPLTAGATDLSNVPLANATTTNILPNIMLGIDNSGSMDWDYMPDYVQTDSGGTNYYWCRGTDSSNTLQQCQQGDAPYFASAFNSVYYNPAIRYDPPANADGTSKTSYNTAALWAAVPNDGYGIQFSGTTNLTTDYPERMWKDTTSSVSCPSADCVSELDASNNYIYPNNTYNHLKTVHGAPYYYNVTVQWCKNRNNSGTYQNYGTGTASQCQAKRDATYKYVYFSGWSRVDIKSTTTFPAKAVERTDCAGATCTYAEEMTNFANWYAWYRTRMQMAKTSIGLAFKDVRGTPNTSDQYDSNYFHARVGITAINNMSSSTVQIGDFNTTPVNQKNLFYTKLYGFNASGSTPLRGALNEIGKMYKGTSSTFTYPIQYSCQKNFTILTTDGYWNDSFTGIGDVDGAATCGTTTEPTRPSCDKNRTANTLADIAYYYYHTDLKPGSQANGACNAADPNDLCRDNVPPTGSTDTTSPVYDVAPWQHMTTFTVGLGVDGTLTYQDGYKTSTSGDYFNILQGTTNWPVPTSNAQTTIDDLWHTAVDGRGTYFSVRDPAALRNGLEKALGDMGSVTGAGAAAATSNLEPTTGDNGIYIATYRTFQWDGELSAYTIDLSNGSISSSSTWQVSPLLQSQIASTGDSDTRTIYIDEAGVFRSFTYANLSSTEQSYFNNANLSQYAGWSAAQVAAATGSTLVNYLRGQDRYEDQDRPVTYGTYQRLYRDRVKILGDIVHSQPIYLKAPPYGFSDAGYSAFKTANASRSPTLYVAANDGMLHAFNAADGTERWAYIPPMALPNLWKLADENYGNNHSFYLDGPLITADAKISGVWKTILIGGMGAGGKGYYAVDVTDPAAPAPLWNFTNTNLGNSYGTPFVTKLGDGTWVVVVTSGYNNTSGDGAGHVFVLNIADGSVLRDISTLVGTPTNPSGLARLNVEVTNFDLDNTAIGAYGGDLYGNMWRFNLDAGTATKLAAFGATQPIMAAPEITDVSGNKVVYFGTGRYLGQSDLTNHDVQSIYAIKDDGTTTVSSTSNLVQQTVTNSGTTQTISKHPVNWSTQSGWFVNLPDDGGTPNGGSERVTIDLQLYYGTVVVASTVPAATPCQPGGWSWLYQLDFRDGGYVSSDTVSATKFTSPIVGLTIARLPTGTPVIYPVTADGTKPPPVTLKLGTSGSATGTKRILWRELVN